MTRKKVLLTDYAWRDLSLERERFGAAGLELVAGPKAAPPPQEIETLCAAHRPHAIMTVWAIVNARAIANCPDLQHIARIGVGLDNIDRHAAAARGIPVTNVPDYCAEEMSDHAVALLLDWARDITFNDREVKRGLWDPSRPRLHRVRTLTVGIAGFGRVGRLVARKLSGFGCRLLAFGRRCPADLPPEVEWADFDALLSQSDALIALLPLDDRTRHLFGSGTLPRMKPGSLLINISRGPLVDNQALLAGLEAGRPGVAALDVIEGEPEPPPEITRHPRIIVTPHVAFSSPSSIAELRQRFAEEVIRVLRGEPPRNPVPPP